MTCPNLEHYATLMALMETTNISDDSTSDPFSGSSEDDFYPSEVTASSSSEIESQETVAKKRCSRYKSQNKKQNRQKRLRNSGLSYTSQSSSKKIKKNKNYNRRVKKSVASIAARKYQNPHALKSSINIGQLVTYRGKGSL